VITTWRRRLNGAAVLTRNDPHPLACEHVEDARQSKPQLADCQVFVHKSRLSSRLRHRTCRTIRRRPNAAPLYPREVPAVSDNNTEIDGLPVFWRSAPAANPDVAPVLYLHGVPSSSDDWIAPCEHSGGRPRWRRWWRRKRSGDDWVQAPLYDKGFLERTGGLAPDLPGFGRSGKPGYLQYTIEEYASFIERFLDMLGVERVRMLVHDWGAVGLAFAQAHPERVERLVVCNAVPLLPGYEWHRSARMWRTPLLGEIAMGATIRQVFKRSTREANVTPGPLPEAWIDSVMKHFDQGTQRAILRLYRSSPSQELARAGERLELLRMPSLVLWGMQDPYIPERFARAYAQALPESQLVELADAGHWWWLDRPDAIERVVEFMNAA
jgi:pimeloyl-ACP methyl ester carboxylesterase